MTTLLFLPAGDAGFRWLRVGDGGTMARGDGVPEGDDPIVAVTPADAVTLHWADLPTRSAAQGVAAARLLAAEASAAPVGELHVAVNNAGIGGPAQTVDEYSTADWRKVLSVDLDGVFYGVRAETRAMLAGGGGSIINMASVFGAVGIETAPAYVAAKHGVVGLTKAAALAHATEGIRVNAVGPAFISTPLLISSMSEEARAGLASQHALGRLGTPEEVAELVAWLASDASSFATGTYYPLDGGLLAR